MSKSKLTPVIVVGGGLSGRIVSAQLRSAQAKALSIVGDARSAAEAGQHNDIETGTCVALTEDVNGVRARLSDGRVLIAEAAILATGCGSFGRPGDELCASPKHLPHEHHVDNTAALAVIGSGRAAVAYALRCIEGGHRGPIHMLSRSGHLPYVMSTAPVLDLAPADIPLGTSLPYLIGWFRKTVEWSHSRGFDAHAVTRGVAPHAGLIWQHLAPRDRRRFVAHLRPLWQAAGEYLPEDEHALLRRAVANGQLTVIRGRHLHVERAGGGYILTYMPAGARTAASLLVSLVANCEDAPPGYDSFSMPMVAALISEGLARPDALQFGLDVSENCALIDSRGRASQRLYAIGAPTRGRFVDALEIARIRKQSERIARSILKNRNRRAA